MASITYVKGDLFQLTKQVATAPVLLAHACNCYGVWGGGIAAAFRTKFPSTYQLYHDYCKERSDRPDSMLGTSLLLPVSPTDPGYTKEAGDHLVVVCLFTSLMGGEAPGTIAEYTKEAMIDLKRQFGPTEVNMPKINAGIFGVPWSLTERALKQGGLPCRVFEIN